MISLSVIFQSLIVQYYECFQKKVFARHPMKKSPKKLLHLIEISRSYIAKKILILQIFFYSVYLNVLVSITHKLKYQYLFLNGGYGFFIEV